MAAARRKAAQFREGSNAIRPRACDGVQDAQIRHLQQPALAIDAACGESRDLPSWPGDNAFATAWGRAGAHRPDALLPRTLSRYRCVIQHWALSVGKFGAEFAKS